MNKMDNTKWGADESDIYVLTDQNICTSVMGPQLEVPGYNIWEQPTTKLYIQDVKVLTEVVIDYNDV
jgi:hypothetical protein